MATIYYNNWHHARDRSESFAMRDAYEPLDVENRYHHDHPTTGEFIAFYSYVGEDDLTQIEDAFRQWNAGSGQESYAFRQAETRSLSVGDVVRYEGIAYVCRPMGFQALPHLTAYLAAYGDRSVGGDIPPTRTEEIVVDLTASAEAAEAERAEAFA